MNLLMRVPGGGAGGAASQSQSQPDSARRYGSEARAPPGRAAGARWGSSSLAQASSGTPRRLSLALCVIMPSQASEQATYFIDDFNHC